MTSTLDNYENDISLCTCKMIIITDTIAQDYFKINIKMFNDCEGKKTWLKFSLATTMS